MTDLVLLWLDVHPSLTLMLYICHLASRGALTMGDPRTYFVYIMSNLSKTLYCGVTNNLMRRVREHKEGTGSCFTSQYRLDRLVYFERFEDVRNAIEREKRIKRLLRIRKIALIVSVNPAWRDLNLEWFERHEFQPDADAASTATPKLSS
jgi:putative endonuclease